MSPTYDLLIRNGTIYDGSGRPPLTPDLAVTSQTIAAIGPLPNAHARTELDAQGLAVAPGFINMLSWANVGLMIDGRSQSDIRQGVTLEIFGEGSSMGPCTDAMVAEATARQDDFHYMRSRWGPQPPVFRKVPSPRAGAGVFRKAGKRLEPGS